MVLDFLKKGLGISLIPLINSAISIFLFKIYIKNYSEVDLADLALISGIASIIGSFNTLNINKALVLENDDRDKISLVFTALLIVGLSLIFSSFGFALLDVQVLSVFESITLGSLFILSSALFKISQSWHLSYGKFSNQSYFILLSGQLNNGMRLFGSDVRSLLSGLILGNMAGSSPILRWLYKSEKKWTLVNFKADLKKTKDFIGYNSIGELFYVLSLELVVFYLSMKYDALLLGSFVFANSILRMASNPFISVLSGMGLYEVANAESVVHVIKVLIINAVVILFCLFCVYLARDYVNELLYLFVPQDWHYTIPLIWLLFPIYAISIVLSPFARILEATRMQKHAFIIQCIRLMSMLLFFYLFEGDFDTFVPIYTYLVLILHLPIVLVLYQIYSKFK